jgi:uncharacterized protein (TIGR03437 family)
LLIASLGLLAIPTTAFAQNFVITTVAGAEFGFGGDGKPALQAQLSQIYDAITDPQGNILVADRSNHQIVRIAPNGILTVVAGNGIDGYSGDGGPATRASLSFPSALAFDGAGNLLIADNGNYCIRRLSPDGVIRTIAGIGVKGYAGDDGPAIAASIDDVRGLAVDRAGNIYFTENSVHRIRRITTDGIVRNYAGNGTAGFAGENVPATQASLREPWHLTFDAAGNLLVADFRNHRVRRITPAGIISTVAGTGVASTSGDGGPATQATLTGPAGIYVDGANNLYIAGFDNRVRRVTPQGIISTIAGTATSGFAGDGGPANQARINHPTGVTGDAAGNIYVADSVNLRVRRVTPQGVISTIAGIGQHRYAGDGGQAVAAAIGFPIGLAVDRDNNVYVSDTNNNRVRKVTPNGVISTVAGTGLAAFSGDNGPSTQAALNYPIGLASDGAGNVYIADALNGRVRRIARNGVITTVAGGAPLSASVPVDGQPATQVYMTPQSITLDGLGNLYIFDPTVCVVFRVTPTGALFRHAGRYLDCGSSGDGGRALDARIAPEGDGVGSISADRLGNVYIAEPNSGRVRRVGLDGVIRTIAGGVAPTRFPIDGEPAATAPLFSPGVALPDDFGDLFIVDVAVIYVVIPDGRIVRLAGNLLASDPGDGGLALNASLLPGAMAFDQNGNLLLTDLNTSRVRAILVDPPAIKSTPISLQFTASSGGAPPPPQITSVTASIPAVGFITQAVTDGGNWIQVTPASGSSPRLVEVSVNPAGLAPGAYRAAVGVGAPFATPSAQIISVTLNVTAGEPPRLDLDKQNFSYAFPTDAAARSQTLTVRNSGGGTDVFTAAASTNHGGNWLTVTPGSSRAMPGSPVAVTVTADPSNLPAGAYTGRVRVDSAGGSREIPLTMTVSANDRAVLLSQTGLSFTAVAGGGVVPPRTFEVLNIGRGVTNWSVSTSTLGDASGWLTATPGNGSTDASSVAVPGVEVRVNQAGLAAGSYYGLVRVTAPDAANSPQVMTVFLEVLPAGSDPGPVIEPAELVFTAAAGGPSPGSKEALVYNIAAAPKTFRSTTVFPAPASATNVRLANLPSDLTLAVNQANRLIVQPFIGNLPPGVYQGGVNLQFTDGRVRTLRVQLIVTAPDARGARLAGACTPARLLPAVTSLTASAWVTAGWPIPVTAEVRDDCGDIHDSGSVVVTFSNGDPPISLQSLKDGRWTGTWNSRASAPSTALKLEAVDTARQIRGELSLTVNSNTRQDPPVVEAGGITSSVGLQPFVPLAPGGLISISGERLADVTQSATGLPLPKQIGSTQVIMGGVQLPLMSVSPTRIDAVSPSGLTPNTSHQLLVQRAGTITRPVPVDVAPAQPAIFVDTSVSPSQGRIVWTRPGTGETGQAQPGKPARAGDSLVIMTAGLGATDPQAADGDPAPPQAQTTQPVTVTIGGIPAPVDSAGLAPGLVGVYQVRSQVPPGVPAGDQTPVVVAIAGQFSPPVTMAVQ